MTPGAAHWQNSSLSPICSCICSNAIIPIDIPASSRLPSKGNGRQDSLSHEAQRLPCSLKCVCQRTWRHTHTHTQIPHAHKYCPRGVRDGFMACNGNSFPHQSLKCGTTQLFLVTECKCVCVCACSQNEWLGQQWGLPVLLMGILLSDSHTLPAQGKKHWVIAMP